MDLSNEKNKPMFVVRKDDLRVRLASLYSYLAAKLQIREVPKVVLTKNKQNAENPFGLTGYYDPDSKTIRLYITDRHDTDILRSFAHEVIHHWQNENGTLHAVGNEPETKDHYAQNDENLRKREMEAYLFGNILFRDWQDENRYGPPEKQPTMPQPINENLRIVHSNRVQEAFKALLYDLVKRGTIISFNRELSSGKMNPNDFVEDLAHMLTSSLNGAVETINNRSNQQSQPNMIKEEDITHE